MKKITLQAVTTVLAFAIFPVTAVELNVYGVGHLSADSVDDGQNTSIFVTSSSSRLGFSGEHDLGSGLTAIFQLETGVDLTAQGGNDGNGPTDPEDAGQLFTKGRPSFVGLKGNFGKILIGHMPALDQWANDYNLFADQVGDLGNLWEGSGIPGRVDNVIYYSTPDMQGITGGISYVPEEGTSGSDHLIFKGDYKKDALKVGLAYASIGQGAGVDDHTAVVITLGYDFGQFTLGGGFQSESDIAGEPGSDRDSLSIGGSVKVGDEGTFKLQFANSSGSGSDSDATLFAIGYDQAMGENYTLYVAYANMSNDPNVAFSVNGKGHGDKIVPAAGDDPSIFSLGFVYKFDVSLIK